MSTTHPTVDLYAPFLALSAPILTVVPLPELRSEATPIYVETVRGTIDGRLMVAHRVGNRLAAERMPDLDADGKMECPRCSRRVKPRRDGVPVRHNADGAPCTD